MGEEFDEEGVKRGSGVRVRGLGILIIEEIPHAETQREEE